MVKKHSFIERTYDEGAHWNYLHGAIPMQCLPTTYVTEIKETYFEIFMSIGFASFKYINLTISIMANCLYLHVSYIAEFDFMKYAFAGSCIVLCCCNRFEKQLKRVLSTPFL